ncbi:hypothetical protein C8Q78DRAFT_1075318 [Trametes maxima]|nr:hypothetical protein C8Q78DRAFT_1075318 [Trametes maxima]
MQRRTSQTFQRLRKLSDSLMQAVVPSLSNKPSRDGSFFEYDRRGWHPPSHPEAHRRPSYKNGQHVSKEDIRYPLLAPKQPNPFDINAEPSRTPTRPPKANAEDRPPVARGSPARPEEQRTYRHANVGETRRPERPREEDLPYGAAGAIPKALAPPYVPPPPAAGHGRHARERERAGNSVPFPEDERAARQRRVVERAYREKPLPVPPREVPRRLGEPTVPFFNSFATVPASKPLVHAPSISRVPAEYAGSHPSCAERRTERGRPEGDPRLPQRQHGVRRISSSGDVHLPPQHSRYRSDRSDKNSASRPPDLRPVKSAPLRAPDPARPVHPRPAPPAPAPAPLMHVAKPHPRNVPRDVSPENPQRLPTPRRSNEEVRSHTHAQPWAAAPTAAAARTGLRVQQSAGPQHVRMAAAPEHLDAMARKAQVVRPAREPRPRESKPLPQPQPQPLSPPQPLPLPREKARGRGRATHTAAVEVEYYGMADAFTQEITIALTEPERATPLPLDWRAYVATGPDYGVRPLVTKKSRLAALGATC